MNRLTIIAAVAFPLCLLACSKSPGDRLQGKWLGDRVTNVSADQATDITAWVKGTSFEFTGTKMTVTIPAEQPRTGEFKVTKADGNKIALAITREGGSAETTSVALAEDNTLRWDVGDGREVVFAKLK
jgi:hypothetical protein